MSRPPRALLLCWLALLGLLALTLGLAYLPMGSGNGIVALVIALAKAILVLAIFMELRRGPSLRWAFAGAGFFWLMILLSLNLTDYLTRAPW
jgi:cytochrome c oxidase subunit 4